eukprot:TRINITY_DN27374_c0_g1_i1.p1 TRINITY_DN27374_c0_g1~~TRINITY_DN27374_c0_g1_i1.p1  ORF type:complete len:1042 (-),score=187.43 TRINITY_DN27374_c0_g1_i1:60-3134(-)
MDYSSASVVDLPVELGALSNDDLAKLQPRPQKSHHLSDSMRDRLHSQARSLSQPRSLGQLPAIPIGCTYSSYSPSQMAMSSAISYPPATHQANPSKAMLAGAPPRLVARLQELELSSLLALCERLEGRLSAPARSAGAAATDEELDTLVEDLAGQNGMKQQLQKQQKQLYYVQRLQQQLLDQSEKNAASLLASSAAQSAGTSPSAAALDNLLAELSALAHAPGKQLHAAAPAAPEAAKAASSKRSPKAGSAGPLPSESIEGKASQRQDVGIQAEPSPAAEVYNSFSEALQMMKAGLVDLAALHAEEVAKATLDLAAENSRLAEELETLRQADHKPPTISEPPSKSLRAAMPPPLTLPGEVQEDRPALIIDTECQTEAFDPETAEAATTMTSFQAKQVEQTRLAKKNSPRPPLPRSLSMRSVGSNHSKLSTESRAFVAFEVCGAWQRELLEGHAVWGEDMKDYTQQPPNLPPWLVHELSFGRTVWDLFGVALILYDIIMTPWAVAFGAPTNLEVMLWLVPSFWLLEIIASLFFTTFSQAGMLQSSPRAIINKYVRSGWFFLDSVTTMVDVLLLISSNNWIPPVSRVVLDNKDVYIACQITRLLRMLRLNKSLLNVRARVRSEWLRAVANFAIPAMAVLLVAHAAACGLQYLGSPSGRNAATWLEEYAQTNQLNDPGAIYLTAMLWVLSQLFPGLGPSPVNPKSVPDMIYVAAVRVLTLLSLVFLLVQLSIFVLRVQELQAEWQRRRRNMRDYFAGRTDVPTSLQQHIWSWLESEPEMRHGTLPPQNAWQGRLCARQMKLQGDSAHSVDKPAPLSALPPKLREELLGKLISPLLTVHPFIHELDVAHPQALRQIIECMSQHFYDPGQEVFGPGVLGSGMLLTAKGDFSYAVDLRLINSTRKAAAPLEPEELRVLVNTRQHVSEASLWFQNWKHTGSLTANGLRRACCETFVIDSVSFSMMIRRGPHELWQAAVSYSVAFAERANNPTFVLTDVDTDMETLLQLTDDAFADALKFLSHDDAEQDTGS